MQGGYGAFFAVRVQDFVSITSVAVQVLLGAGYKSRFTRFYRKHWRGRGIGITKLSWVQEQIAKNVTNKLPLLSVLCLGIYLCLESGSKGFNLGIQRGTFFL